MTTEQTQTTTPTTQQSNVDCIVVSQSEGFFLFYDPESLRVVQWMRKHRAWHGTMESVAYNVTFGVLVRHGEPEVVAGLAFAHYTGDDVEIALAVAEKKAWSRRFINYVFSYAYDTLGVTRVTAKIAVDNEDSLDVAERIGFQREGILRKYRYGVDHVLLGMLRDECVWLKRG